MAYKFHQQQVDVPVTAAELVDGELAIVESCKSYMHRHLVGKLVQRYSGDQFVPGGQYLSGLAVIGEPEGRWYPGLGKTNALNGIVVHRITKEFTVTISQ